MDRPGRLYLFDQKGNIRQIYGLVLFNDRQLLIDMQKLLTELLSL